MKRPFTLSGLRLPVRRALTALLACGWSWAAAQNVGIGTNQPSQALDVNGSLRVRGLSGTGSRILQIQPDGTVGTNAPLYTTSPTSELPTQLGSVATDNGVRGVALSGNTACVVNFDAGTLQTYDVSSPGAPVLRSTVSTNLGSSNRPTAVAMSGSRAYVVGGNSGSGGLRIFDVSNPAAPTQVGTLSLGLSPLNSITVAGPVAYIGSSSRFQAVNVSNPASLSILSSTPTTNSSVSGLAVSGNILALVGSGGGGLQLFDVSSPAAPQPRGALATANSSAARVTVSGSTAYVVSSAGSGDALQAFNISNPAAPSLLGSATLATEGRGVAVAAPVAYVLTRHGVAVYNISNPAALSQISAGLCPGCNVSSGDLVLQGSTVLVAAATGGQPGTLTSYQQSQPAPPRIISVNADGSLGSAAPPTLSLNGQDLSISGGNTVALPLQTLSASGLTLSISGGNSVTLPGDNLGNGVATTDLRLPDTELYLRGSGDFNHGLGWYGNSGSTRNWQALNIDGPVLYGNNGGVLGYTNGSQGTALRWTSSGNVAVGSQDPAVRLDVDGALALRPDASATNLTADNQAVAVGNRSYLRLTSNSATATQRTISLGNGLAVGQVLLIENTTSPYAFEVAGSSTVLLASGASAQTMTPADVLQLIWNGSAWVQLSYSNN